MIARIILLGWTLAVIGCGGEPDRSRVVRPSEVGRNPDEPTHRLEPGEIQKIDMH